jgi:hypothetical protein
MMDLSYRRRNRAEQAELDQLHRRYPGMPLKHYDPMYETNRFTEEKILEYGADGLVEDGWYSIENALWKRLDRYR